jgi:hypothetical protein
MKIINKENLKNIQVSYNDLVKLGESIKRKLLEVDIYMSEKDIQSGKVEKYSSAKSFMKSL